MTLGWVEAQQGFDRTGLAGNTLHRSCFNTMVIALIILITTIILSVKNDINTSILIPTNISYASIIFIILIELEWPATPCIDPVPPNCHLASIVLIAIVVISKTSLLQVHQVVKIAS